VGKHNQPWTVGEVRKLKSLTVDAVKRASTAELKAAFPDRTIGSIRYAIHEHGYADPVRSAYSSKAVRISEDPEKLRELEALLRGEGRFWPPSVVAERFGVVADTVTEYRKLWVIPNPSRSDSWHDPVYRKWWKANRRNRRKSYAVNMAARRDEMRQALEDLKFDFRDAGLEKRQCGICGAILWKSEKFFHRFTNKNGSYLSGICLACPRKGKRKIPRT